VSAGGSITGEHGVGIDKAAYMGEMFSDTDLETMNWLRCSFDPENRFNPGKVFPTPRLCGDRPGKYVPHATEVPGQIGRGWTRSLPPRPPRARASWESPPPRPTSPRASRPVPSCSYAQQSASCASA